MHISPAALASGVDLFQSLLRAHTSPATITLILSLGSSRSSGNLPASCKDAAAEPLICPARGAANPTAVRRVYVGVQDAHVAVCVCVLLLLFAFFFFLLLLLFAFATLQSNKNEESEGGKEKAEREKESASAQRGRKK